MDETPQEEEKKQPARYGLTPVVFTQLLLPITALALLAGFSLPYISFLIRSFSTPDL